MFIFWLRMHEVSLINVTHHYGSKTAIQGVSIDFRKHKITGIIGRSGSGKSTILKTINGLVEPEEGEVIISGNTLTKENLLEKRRYMGYVVQGNGLFPHLTIADNIFIPARIAGEQYNKEFADKIKTILQLVDLTPDYASRLPHQLSGGEQQRVALARALFLKPPVILMDEPFGSLDPVSRKEMNEMLLKLQATLPATVIMVTHDVIEARRVADDLVVIDKGRVIQHGSMESVINAPADDLVRALIRTSTL
jgi:osmoprotectant transport system ATP-binding protein